MRPHDLIWFSERLQFAVEDFHQMRTPSDRRRQLAYVEKLRGRIAEMILPVVTTREAKRALHLRTRALRAAGDLLIERAEKVMGYV